MSENKVVDFAQKKLEKSPHISGTVICVGCRHEWVAVLPHNPGANLSELECPQCTAHRGILKYSFNTEKPTLECPACQCHFFMVSSDGVHCIGCGTFGDFKTVFGE